MEDGYVNVEDLKKYNKQELRKKKLNKFYSNAKKYGSKFASIGKNVAREGYKFGEYAGKATINRPDMKKNAGYQILQGFMNESTALKPKGKRAKKKEEPLMFGGFGGL